MEEAAIVGPAELLLGVVGLLLYLLLVPLLYLLVLLDPLVRLT